MKTITVGIMAAALVMASGYASAFGTNRQTQTGELTDEGLRPDSGQAAGQAGRQSGDRGPMTGAGGVSQDGQNRMERNEQDRQVDRGEPSEQDIRRRSERDG